MLDRSLAVLSLALLVPIFVGGTVACGGATCESQCNRSQTLDCDHDGQPDNGSGTNCAQACADYKATNDASGCGPKFSDFTNCLAGISDLCTGTGPCDPKLAAWTTCVQDYCAANPSGPGCALPG